jgi:hypothetical protein
MELINELAKERLYQVSCDRHEARQNYDDDDIVRLTWPRELTARTTSWWAVLDDSE